MQMHCRLHRAHSLHWPDDDSRFASYIRPNESGPAGKQMAKKNTQPLYREDITLVVGPDLVQSAWAAVGVGEGDLWTKGAVVSA